MKSISLSVESEKSVTLISNSFIDIYLKDANDAQIKIYLYLLRMLQAGLPTDISIIADTFNLTEKDVLRSLNYWEKNNILSISEDKEGQITSIIFKESSCEQGSLLSADEKSVIDTEQAKQPTSSEEVISEEIKEPIPMIRMDYNTEKASYTLARLKELKSDETVSMLLFAAGQYFGRPLNPSEIRSLLFIYDRLGFSMDLTVHLIEYCIEREQVNIHYIEQTAINWYEAGVSSVSEAKKQSKAFSKNIYTIMEYLGKTGKPAPAEAEYINRWLSLYGFSLSIIEEACKRAVLRTDNGRFAYADGILKNWCEKGVHTLNDIKALDTSFNEAGKAKAENRNTSNKPSTYTGIDKRDYDFSELEKKLISN